MTESQPFVKLNEQQQEQQEHQLQSTLVKSKNTKEMDNSLGVCVPWKGVLEVGIVTGKLVGTLTAPLPWISPIIELVETIVNLCKMVRKNKCV